MLDNRMRRELSSAVRAWKEGNKNTGKEFSRRVLDANAERKAILAGLRLSLEKLRRATGEGAEGEVAALVEGAERAFLKHLCEIFQNF